MRGFTLLEVLAALVVLGLLIAGLSQGMQFGLRAWEMQARDLTARGDLETTDRAIRLMLRRLRPATEAHDRGVLEGEPEACAMLTLLPPSPAGGMTGPPGGAVAVRLEVDAARRLVLRWVPAPHVIWFRRPPPQEVVLLDRVERIEFAYWKQAEGGGGAWQRSWNDTEAPSLVRLRLVFPRGDPRHWPDIVAAPRLDRGASRFLLFPADGNVNIARGSMAPYKMSHAG